MMYTMQHKLVIVKDYKIVEKEFKKYFLSTKKCDCLETGHL